MDSRVAANRAFLAGLFTGPFRGHAIVLDHEPVGAGMPGDVACSDRPVRDWLDSAVKDYEAQVALPEGVGAPCAARSLFRHPKPKARDLGMGWFVVLGALKAHRTPRSLAFGSG